MQEKRRKILDATLKLISQFGFHGTPMSLIAEQAGVGAGTIYRYFENKEALIMKLFLKLKAEISQEMLNGFDSTRPPEQVFRQVWLNTFHYCIQHPAEMMFLEQYHNSPFLTPASESAVQDMLAPLVKYAEKSTASGQVKEMPFEMLTIFVYDTTIALAKRHISGFLKVDEFALDLAVQASWDAVKGPAA
ncbi:MAG: TetR/AcrR family transcriptional regulator [Anaerolineales bacterium]|nr:TetR/AcrR family transcriptional regulator [Anaerolineales bacterium]